MSASEQAQPSPVVVPVSRHDRFAELVSRPGFWIAFIALLFSVVLARAFRSPPVEAPELDLPLPAFSLTDHHGDTVTLADLRGIVWVANFVFTSCPTVCPKLTKRMEQIEHRAKNLGDSYHLVTITVDPENDTPERLAQFASNYHVDPRRWSFLTGPLDVIEPTVVQGFKMAMGKEESSPGLFSIFHGERLVLVDQRGHIRGYFEADDAGVDEILRQMGILANQPPAP